VTWRKKGKNLEPPSRFICQNQGDGKNEKKVPEKSNACSSSGVGLKEQRRGGEGRSTFLSLHLRRQWRKEKKGPDSTLAYSSISRGKISGVAKRGGRIIKKASVGSLFKKRVAEYV